MLICSLRAHRQQAPGEAEGGENQARLDRNVNDGARHAVRNDLRNNTSQAVNEPRSGAPYAAQQAGALRRASSLRHDSSPPTPCVIGSEFDQPPHPCTNQSGSSALLQQRHRFAIAKCACFAATKLRREKVVPTLISGLLEVRRVDDGNGEGSGDLILVVILGVVIVPSSRDDESGCPVRAPPHRLGKAACRTVRGLDHLRAAMPAAHARGLNTGHRACLPPRCGGTPLMQAVLGVA